MTSRRQIYHLRKPRCPPLFHSPQMVPRASPALRASPLSHRQHHHHRPQQARATCIGCSLDMGKQPRSHSSSPEELTCFPCPPPRKLLKYCKMCTPPPPPPVAKPSLCGVSLHEKTRSTKRQAVKLPHRLVVVPPPPPPPPMAQKKRQSERESALPPRNANFFSQRRAHAPNLLHEAILSYLQ